LLAWHFEDRHEMNVAKALRDHFLRIDGRSLGLFRLAFGVVLLGDLFRRWAYAKEFYSNDGVLPNHNHLFNLRDKEKVWSLLHSISSPGEADFAFCVILFVYVCFLLGYRTRAFHILSVVCLVSLTGRNILLENSGNHVAIALLAFTAFLPTGSRFSLDSLARSMAARDEKTARELDDRRRPDADGVNAARLPGWSPASLAGLAVLGQLAVIYVAAAMQQKGALWQDGSALHYALNSERWVSAAGAAARGFLGPASLAAWTRAFRAAEWAIPVLIFIPVMPRVTRGLAVALAVFHALTVGIFFSFGLYGWSLLAAAALLLPRETWDAIEEHPIARRTRTVIYDADCGVCLWLTRVLKRLDLRGNLTFQGNDDLEGLSRRKAGAVSRDPLPKEVTADLVASSVVAVDPEGRVSTRARAVSEVVQALPLGQPLALVMRLPGVVQLLDLAYDFIATRRIRISVAMGKEACGIPAVAEPGAPEAPAPDVIEPVAPATRLRRGVQAVLRDLAVAVVFAAMLAQTGHENDLGWKLPRPGWLAGVATWPRMMARWDVLASPPLEDEVVVIDAQTKGGRTLDPLTYKEPEWNPGAMRGTGLGQLWNDYLYRIHDPKWLDFQRAFRDYISKGGPRATEPQGDNQLVGLDAYWLKQPIPRPGEPREPGLSGREKIFTQSRGGRAGAEKALPLLRPELIKPR
jgi:predicted DCC family thiol-disulfide oxidoreductase YuxK